MYDSILQFVSKGTDNLENACADFFEKPDDIAGFVNSVCNILFSFGCEFIGEAFDELDSAIRNSPERKAKYDIVRRDNKKMLCSLGEFSFRKTLYKHKKSGERSYLLDKYVGFDSYERITEDAQARMLEEAAGTSYSRAGNAVSLTDFISKSAVKDRLHRLKFPELVYDKPLKKVDYLYIDADEDHVPLQFITEKGDLKSEFGGAKHNNVLAKLVYVYEGIEPESPSGKRFRLKNPHYFSGVYEGKENKILWNDVKEYIENTYDVANIKRIYLNADGGKWIREGSNHIAGLVNVLDEYHINKYLAQMTSHLYDSAAEGKTMLRNAIRSGDRKVFSKAVNTLKSYAESDAELKRIEGGAAYISSSWNAAHIRLVKDAGVAGSSTEGHVSHVLASRMSSRPMGWSKKGVNNMAKLRVYRLNGGKMLDLVRYQSEMKGYEKAAGNEVAFTSTRILRCEKEHHHAGRYYDKLQVSLKAMARKKLAIREHIGLI